MSQIPENTLVYSISRLNTEVRQVLESGFPLVWVEGEISNLSLPRSGHMYFSLKDAHAQTRCAMFRMKRQLLRFNPAEGQRVLCRARITLYEARGDFQLVIEHMEMAGEGQLRQAIEALKQKLESEGLFDPALKKPLPAIPQTVGVITSATGAAIRDVLNVLQRRFPAIRVIVYPVLVQGEQAAADIIRMLKIADQRRECDVLILTRGGGSLEDLMAFNDEQLARTIHALQTPVVSAIGHEIDNSISDYVADRRAATPSAAAELISPDIMHLKQQVTKSFNNLRQQMLSQLRQLKQKSVFLDKTLLQHSPQRKLQENFQRLDHLSIRLGQLSRFQLQSKQHQLAQIDKSLQMQSPHHKISRARQQFNNLKTRMNQASPIKLIHTNSEKLHHGLRQLTLAMQHKLQGQQKQLESTAKLLDSVSPLATLSRGYSITRNQHQEIIKSTRQLSKGEQIETRLGDGSVISSIHEIIRNS